MKYLIIALVFLYSCSAERRCQKHIAKARALGCLSFDTTIIRDTIKGYVYDTTFRSDTVVLKDIDTFESMSDGVAVKTIVKWKTRTVDQVVTKRDTIIEHVNVIKTVIVQGKCSHLWCNIKLGIAIALLAGAIFAKFK